MLNRRTTLKLAAAALPLTALASACGGSGGSGGGASAPAATPTGNKLTVWCWDPNFNIYSMKEAEKVYKKTHPDFTLNIIETSWDDLQTKLTTLAQSKQTKELPDIFLCQNNAYQKNVINYPTLFTDFSKSGVDFKQVPSSVVAYSTIDNKNYGMPFDAGTAIGAYRTDLLQQAGLTVKDFTDISWNDFLEKGKQVKAKTGKPMLSSVSGGSDFIMMTLQSVGASLFDKAGKPTIAGNDSLIKAIQVYQKLVKEGVLLQVTSWDEYIGSLNNSQVVGTINGIWIVGSLQAAKDQSGKWDVTNVPKVDGVSSATNFTANGGSSWAVSANANAALAFDFLKSTFAGSTELYDTILPKAGAVANWTPAGKSAVYSQPQPFFSNTPVFAKVVEYSGKVPSNNTGAYYYEGRDSVSASITKILNGADLTASLAEAQKAVEFAMK